MPIRLPVIRQANRKGLPPETTRSGRSSFSHYLGLFFAAAACSAAVQGGTTLFTRAYAMD